MSGNECSVGAGTESTPIEITEAIAVKVLETVDAGLSFGLGAPTPGLMCVEAAVCYALGMPHGDKPKCVDPVLRSLKIVLNDSDWSSTQARAAGMRRLAVAQLGSAGALDQRGFAHRVADSVSVYAGTREEGWAKDALETADQRAFYSDKLRYLEDGMYWTVARIQRAAMEAAYEGLKKSDLALSKFAEDVVQILIEMKAPGCRWLFLTEPPDANCVSTEDGGCVAEGPCMHTPKSSPE